MVSGGHDTSPIAPISLIIPSYPAASLPANAPDGSLAYDSTNDKLVVRAGGSWETVTSA